MHTKSLRDYISSQAKKKPQKIALLKYNKEGFTEESITYKDLSIKVESVASWLLSKNIKKGDVIGLAMHNSPILLIISWAAWSTGVITMPLDVKRDTLEQHIFKLRISKAKLLIAEKNIFTDIEKKALKELPVIEESDFISNKVKNIPWEKSISHRALILFTSGTTSHPRGVILSAQNLIINASSIIEWFNIKENDRFMVTLPLHHINSTTFCLATLLSSGSIAVFPSYSNSMFWKQVAISNSTFTSIVPSICFDQLSNIKEFEKVKDKILLSKIQIGSAPVLASDVREFIKIYEIPLYQGYGQTETSLRVTGVPLDLDKELYKKLIDLNSIGKPMSWADVEVMDNNGSLLKENQEGEVVVKGKAIMEGYLDNGEAFKKGYFLTGDIGYYKIIGKERYFFLKGRRKEIIIKNGINISPVAVENRLKKINKNIDQVYVIGVPDRRSGEEVAAVVVWKNVDTEKAKASLKYNLTQGVENISQYETPRFIKTIVSQDLPMTSTGKIQRSLIKEKIPYSSFESIYSVFKNDDFTFIQLNNSSPYLKQSFDLYNFCWNPLILEFSKFKSQLKNQVMIGALNKDNKIVGLISIIRTEMPENQLCLISYSKLINLKQNINGKSFICVSICSANYKKRESPNVHIKTTNDQVEAYLKSGKDGVFNFHLKTKGGLSTGAKFVCLIPNGRPEDKSSLGFNMLLKYSKIGGHIKINKNSSVASQLIEVVMLQAAQLGVENVYAFSRPAGLAKYLAEKTKGKVVK